MRVQSLSQAGYRTEFQIKPIEGADLLRLLIIDHQGPRRLIRGQVIAERRYRATYRSRALLRNVNALDLAQKEWRRLATRYDRCPTAFLSAIASLLSCSSDSEA